MSKHSENDHHKIIKLERRSNPEGNLIERNNFKPKHYMCSNTDKVNFKIDRKKRKQTASHREKHEHWSSENTSTTRLLPGTRTTKDQHRTGSPIPRKWIPSNNALFGIPLSPKALLLCVSKWCNSMVIGIFKNRSPISRHIYNKLSNKFWN